MGHCSNNRVGDSANHRPGGDCVSGCLKKKTYYAQSCGQEEGIVFSFSKDPANDRVVHYESNRVGGGVLWTIVQEGVV